MFLSKSRRGYYYIWYTDDRGKRRKVSTRCRLKTDALKVLMDVKALAARRGSSVMLSQFIQDFHRYATATYSAATVDMYDRTLNLFKDKASDRLLNTITARHVDDYKVWRLGTIRPVSVLFFLTVIAERPILKTGSLHRRFLYGGFRCVFLGLAQSLSLKDTIIPAVCFIRDVWIADRPEHRTLCRSTVCEVCTRNSRYLPGYFTAKNVVRPIKTIHTPSEPSVPSTAPECRDCRVAMDAGLMLDRADWGSVQPVWIKGTADKGIFGSIKERGRERLPVVTFRCPNCGRLESFAQTV